MNRLGTAGEIYVRHRLLSPVTAAEGNISKGKLCRDSANTTRRDLTRSSRSNLGSRVTTETVLEFADKFDQLVDVLCCSAKEGVTDARQFRYLELREWFAERIISFEEVLTFAKVEAESCGCMETLQTLFQPESIEGVINSESVILRMMRTGALVNSCRAKAELDRA